MEAPAEAVRTPSGSSDGSLTNPDDKLRLLSVVGGDPLFFDWKQGESNTDMVNIIFDLINLCMEKMTMVKTTFLKHKSLDQVNKEEFEEVRAVLDVFNTVAGSISKLWKGATNPEAESWSQDRADIPLLTLICSIVFNSAVSSARRLNSHYQPWSSEVYGETRYEQMQLIIDQLKFKESDVFVDLGSGVGHLVLYVAGGTRVKKAVGIERAALPSEYAENMKTEFHRWMRWWKKKYRPFMLEKGDFLDDKFRDLITKEATIIFINNYAFTPDLETCIKRELLSECRDGTRIVSTKSYATGTKEINDRLLNDVESILDVRQLDTVEHPTSWTDKHVPYFLHTVNRGRLEKYFQDRAAGKSSSQSTENSRRESLSSKDSNRSSPEDDLGVGNKSHVKAEGKHENGDGHEGSHDDNYDEENARGPTTRHRWKEYVNDLDRKKRKGTPIPGSPRWNEADRDYVPPGAKKPRKQNPVISGSIQVQAPPKGGGAKSSKRGPGRPPRSRVSEDARAGMEEMHSLIASPRPVETEGAGLVRVALSSPPIPTVLPPGARIFDPANPLHNLIINFHDDILQHMAEMRTAEYLTGLRDDIAAQTVRKTRNSDLKEKVRSQDALVSACLAQGVAHLRNRLCELDMSDVETPCELLQGSKRIVAQHKDLTQRVSSSEAEVAAMEGKLRTMIPYGDKLVEKLHLLDGESSEPDRYWWLIQQTATEAGQPVPRIESDNETADGLLSPVSAQRRARQRPRTGPGGRKGKIEENSEEMERQIQEIVQAALKVDSVAKERERRARGIDKSARKGPAVPASTAEFYGIMDIATNELTRHFKIPHKKRGSPEAEIKYGSTMVDSHDSREFSQRDIKVMKMRHKRRHDNDGRGGEFTIKKFKPRDTAVAHVSSPCPSSSPAPMPSTSDPLALVDRICGEMTNRVKKEKKERWDESPEKTGPCRTLTKEALERHAQDDTMAREFTRRESLMERLLGHKMLFGRVESYTSMGYIKVDPIIDRVKGRRDFDDEETSGPSAAFRRGPRTPPLPQNDIKHSKQRGPKTPPGSPGPRTPPPPPADDMSVLLSNVAAIAGTTDQQLQSYLGEDLSRAMGNVDKNVLLETLKNALRTVGQAQMPSTPTKIDQEKVKLSPLKPKKDHDNSSVKMELVSECSLSPPPSFPPVSGREAPLLEAPPPPPVIAPPPPPPNLPIFVPFVGDFSAPPMTVTQPYVNGQVVTTTVNPSSDYIVPPPKFQAQACTQQTSTQAYPSQGLQQMSSVSQQSLPLGVSPIVLQNQAPPTIPGGQQLSGPPPFMNIPPPALNMTAQGTVAQSQPNIPISISNAPPALPLSMRHPIPSGTHSVSLPPPLPSTLSQPPPPLPTSGHPKNSERTPIQIPNVSVPPPTLPPPSELPIVRVKINDNSPLYSNTKGFFKENPSQNRNNNWQERIDEWKNEPTLDNNDISSRDPSASNCNLANIRGGLLPSNNTLSRGGILNPGGRLTPICSQLGMRGSHSATGPSSTCAPSTQNVTSTLLSALGIGPPLKQTQPPPPEPPILLDRYGCPLPVPGSRPPLSLGDSSPTNGLHTGHRGTSNHPNRSHPGPPRPLLSVGVSGVVRRGSSNEQRAPRKGGRPYKPPRD